MIHGLAKGMASVFIFYGESSEEDADIYTYVCEAVIAILFNIVVCLIIASFFWRITEGIIFVAGFALLRRYAGGIMPRHILIAFRHLALYLLV